MTVLNKMIREVRQQTRDIRPIYEHLLAHQDGLHKVILYQLTILIPLIEAAMRANANLFEARTNDADRTLSLQLDEAYREQLNLLKKLLDFSPRITKETENEPS